MRKHIENAFFMVFAARSARAFFFSLSLSLSRCARVFSRLLFFPFFLSFFLSFSLSLSKCFVFFLCVCAGGEMSPLSLSLLVVIIINLVVLLLLL